MTPKLLETSSSLVGLQLIKSDVDGDQWKFSGIASDEEADEVGDTLLRKSLDVSYAATRGFVNWDHKTEPAFQIGYLTKCEILGKADIPKLEKSLGVSLSPTASVYVEGELYRHNEHAIDVQRIMKSVPGGIPTALGLSLDGAMAREKASGEIVKAFVRGVAITHKPAHSKTLLQLRKSIEDFSVEAATELADPALAEKIATIVREELRKSVGGQQMSVDQAILWVLQKRPTWNYDVASKFVHYTIQARS